MARKRPFDSTSDLSCSPPELPSARQLKAFHPDLEPPAQLRALLAAAGLEAVQG